MKTLAVKIHSLTRGDKHEQVYQLLCRLAGTVGKQYDDEEQVEALIEECEMWEKNPNCFNK